MKDPRSRVLKNPESLEEWELIAILLGKGSRGYSVEELSRTLLARFNGLYNLLNTPVSVLEKELGMKKAKIANLYAAREIVNRLKLFGLFHQESRSGDFYSIIELLLLRSRREVRECFFLLTFDCEDKLINLELIARGSLREVGIYCRDLVKLILDDGAASAIISHNHPGHSCLPSPEDLELFQNLYSLLSQLEVELKDQWILGNNGVFSCKEMKELRSIYRHSYHPSSVLPFPDVA